MTPELMDALLQYAQGRAKLVCYAGKPVPETYARELVDDVHADICVGDLAWEPQRGLLDHLKAAIKKRTWLEIRRARRVGFVSLDEAVEAADDESMPLELEQAFAPAPPASCDPVMLYAMTITVCRQLRSLPLVSRDVEAAAIVRCWADGFLEKNEVMRRAGLADAAYEGARRRLRKAIPSLPSELREAVRDVLGSLDELNHVRIVVQ
jgi:hypothetical protein